MPETADEILQSFADSASRMENSNTDYGSPGDEKLFVRFSEEPHLNEVLTRSEGRPRFEMAEYIMIMAPGDKDNIVRRPVREPDKQRFAAHYTRFKSGLSQSVGTPLKEWPQLSRNMVEELAYFKITTIEELAHVNDGVIGRYAGLVELRQKAQKHLDLLREQAPIDHLNAELKKRDEDIAGLRAQVEQLLAIQAAKTEVKASKAA